MIDLPCKSCGQPRAVINGAWLRWKREAAGIDQRSLGKTIRVSGPYLSDLEGNRRECPDSIYVVYKNL